MAFPSKQTASAHMPAAQKAAAVVRKQKKEVKLSPTSKLAIELMVFEGMKRSEAAEAAGMADISLRQALLKPHNLAYLNECMEVLRTSARPRALRKMDELLDAKTERIQFEAAKYLDGMDRPNHAVGATQVNVQVNNTVSVTPGYVIRIDRSQDRRPQQIEHLGDMDANAMASNEDVPYEE
jgi:hypothetical protein